MRIRQHDSRESLEEGDAMIGGTKRGGLLGGAPAAAGGWVVAEPWGRES